MPKAMEGVSPTGPPRGLSLSRKCILRQCPEQRPQWSAAEELAKAFVFLLQARLRCPSSQGCLVVWVWVRVSPAVVCVAGSR